MTQKTHSRVAGVALAALLCTALAASALIAPPPADPLGEPDNAWEAVIPFELNTNDLDVGFVASRDRTLDQHERLRGLGPVLERQRDAEGRTFKAVRPFFSRTSDPSQDRAITDILWPVGQIRENPNDSYWRFLLAYGQDMDPDEESAFRTVLFPLFFYGRDANDENYMALFPLGGKIHDYLGYDTINFVLFPAYAKTERGSVTSQSVLWPLVTWARGDDSEKLRVFPFYGRSSKDGKVTRNFVMWPIWTSARYLREGSEGSGFVLFPLVGHVRRADRTSWMFLPPLFRFSTAERAVERNCPWPFVQYKNTKDTKKLYLWPFWGNRKTHNTESTFYAWPIFWNREADRQRETMSSFKALPFWHHETLTAKPPPDDVPTTPDIVERYWKLWPLMTYRRAGDASRFRLLALWPVKQSRPIEQNLAPLWSLFSRQTDGDRFEEELLWGLYRRSLERDGTRNFSLFPFVQSSTAPSGDRRWSFLGGLFGYERKQLRRRATLLYFLRLPLGTADDNLGNRQQPKEEAGEHP